MIEKLSASQGAHRAGTAAVRPGHGRPGRAAHRRPTRASCACRPNRALERPRRCRAPGLVPGRPQNRRRGGGGTHGAREHRAGVAGAPWGVAFSAARTDARDRSTLRFCLRRRDARHSTPSPRWRSAATCSAAVSAMFGTLFGVLIARRACGFHRCGTGCQSGAGRRPGRCRPCTAVVAGMRCAGCARAASQHRSRRPVATKHGDQPARRAVCAAGGGARHAKAGRRFDRRSRLVRLADQDR
jgi:hypothetical protein